VKRSWLWEAKIYVWQFRSRVEFRFRWQAIIREESRLQSTGFKCCTLKLSCPEVLLTFFELIFANNADSGCYTLQYLLQAANVLSVNWKWPFHISGPHWLRTSQGRLCDIALMRIKRDKTAKVCFDEIIDDFTSIKAQKVLLCFN